MLASEQAIVIAGTGEDWPDGRTLTPRKPTHEPNPDYARGADFGGDTGATVWYKRSVHNVLATTETPA